RARRLRRGRALRSGGSGRMTLSAPESRPQDEHSNRRGDGAIALVALSKHFGDALVVNSIDVGIAGGEFYSFLGPSGCGKTTTLRMIGGFERPSAGQVLLTGPTVNELKPWERDVRTGFQSYALFPHLTALGNVEFGLRERGVSDRRDRALGELELVQLSD